MTSERKCAPPKFSHLSKAFVPLAFVGVAIVISVLLLGAGPPHQVTATALFQVEPVVPSCWNGMAGPKMNQSEFEILKKTQLALLKSNFVLSAALRDPKINSLPLIQDQADPVAWLREHLAVQFPENGAILSISLSGSEAQSKELVQLVDAVVKAYKDEVIVESRVRVLGTRDLLAKNLENFDKELKQKKATYLDIAREAGKTEAYGSNIAQQLTAKRLELTEGEIMRLETELAVEPNADGTKRKAIQKRISQLKKIQEKLMNEVRTLSMRSSELESRRHDLQRLQHIADELSATVEKMDIDASCPDRIHQIQAAAISQD